jgi:hypothetical protein
MADAGVPFPTTTEMRDAYLARLGIISPEAPSLAFLQRLQRAHVQAIPYENLDVLSGRPVSLDPSDLYRKIIVGARGGYCFELNILFGWLLRELGYAPEFRMGRVWLRDPDAVPPRNHGTHVVQIEGGAVIADVGFGGRAPRRPLDLAKRDVSIDDGDARGEPLRISRGWVRGYGVEAICTLTLPALRAGPLPRPLCGREVSSRRIPDLHPRRPIDRIDHRHVDDAILG